jgi:uncharacterized NAD(P)/FAD-binding protein YdhS
MDQHHRPFVLAIVGGGLTATAMLHNLVWRLRQETPARRVDPARVGIQMFEKQPVFGPGFPHSEANVLPFHITNMCAQEMGIPADSPSDFQDWVDANRERLAGLSPDYAGFLSGPAQEAEPCRHYPRALMGEYLKQKFEQALRSARQAGMRVELFPNAEVVDLTEERGGVRLAVRDLLSGGRSSALADRVLLATGHWFGAHSRGRFFPSPWPARQLLQGIPGGQAVAVIGTSLSAIEVALTLSSDGCFERDGAGELVYLPSGTPRQVVLYSRGGMLPRVRGRSGEHRTRFFTRERIDELLQRGAGELSLDALFGLLDRELHAAYGHPVDWEALLGTRAPAADRLARDISQAREGDSPGGSVIWQDVLRQILPLARELYLGLSRRDRQRFDRRYTTLFFAHAATQPILNAEKLLALIRAGVADVRQLGRDYQLIEDASRERFRLIYQDGRGERREDRFRYVVNARGQERSLLTNPSALIKNLIDAGTVQLQTSADGTGAYETGSIWIDPRTHQITRTNPAGEREVARNIYAVGAMTRGQIIDASMARGLIASTVRVADDLVAFLAREA